MSKRTRMALIVVVGGAVMVGLWFWIGWWSLLVLIVIIWLTWDSIGFSSRAEKAHPVTGHKWKEL